MVPVDPDTTPTAVDRAPERPRTAFRPDHRAPGGREAADPGAVAEGGRGTHAILRWAVGYAWHVFRFHAVRAPIYRLRFMLWAPHGLYRTVRAILDGLLDAEARPLRRSAVVADDAKTWMTLAKERNARVRHRATAAVGGAGRA
jgi:S-DNA-T family DNA segregation ATPase FtsK/SpoIIIE